MGLSAVSYQAVLRKGDKADGPGEGLLTPPRPGEGGGLCRGLGRASWKPAQSWKAGPSWALKAANLFSSEPCFWLRPLNAARPP